MNAYSKVEPSVRRKLEEMLYTWKQPVPNSSSSNPVFSSEVTRKIDNALIKARTAALQHQQKQMKQQSQDPKAYNRSIVTPPPQLHPQYKSTPPPIANGPSQYMNGQSYDYGNNSQGVYGRNTVGYRREYPMVHPYAHILQAVLSQSAPANPTGMSAPFSQQSSAHSTGSSVDTLLGDISGLIEVSQKRFAEDPLNQEIQKRLKALLDLKTILQTQQLPPAQLALVREQVTRLANPTPPPAMAIAPPPPPPPPPPPAMQLPFSKQDLAALLATATQNQPLVAPPSIPPPPPPPPPSAPPALLPSALPNMFAPPGDAASLFASLQKAGLLPGLSANIPPPPPPPPTGLPSFLFPVPGSSFTPPPPPIPPQIPMRQGKLDWRSIDVEMNTMSLKM